MINRFLTFLLLVVSAVAASAANPTLENFDQTHFRTNNPPPGIIRTRLSSSNFDQSGDTWTITNISGALNPTDQFVPYRNGNDFDDSLLEYRTTNYMTMHGFGAGLFIGSHAEAWYGGGLTGEAVVAANIVAEGDPDDLEMLITSVNGSNSGEFHVSGSSTASTLQLSVNGASPSQLSLTSRGIHQRLDSGDFHINFDPFGLIAATAPFYFNQDAVYDGTNVLAQIDYRTNTQFRVNIDSGYTGTGAKWLSDDGTYSVPGTSGITMNPTDGRVPYRFDATTLQDSPWFYHATNIMSFGSGTNQFLWQQDSDTFALGWKAAGDRILGNNNVAIGMQAMESADGQFQSVALGNFALKNNGGSDNTAIGHKALEAVNAIAATSFGANNTAVGFVAMNNITNGYNNVAVGAEALQDVGDGRENTGLGYHAGDLFSGVNSIFLGSRAGNHSSQTVLTNVAVLAYNARATNNNEFIVGNPTNYYVFPGTSLIVPGAAGYTGGGTLFLSDDGTYKSAGGVGSANWTGVGTTNSTLAGEATVDTLRIETTDPLNIPLVIDTAAGHTNWMANVNNGGTNYMTIDQKGNIGIGITNLFPNKSIGITRVYDQEGSNDPAWINIGALDTYPSYNFAGEWWVKAGTNDVIMQSSWLGAGGTPQRDLRFYNGSADPLFYIATAVNNVEKFKVMGATGDITTPGFVRADTMHATNGITASVVTATKAFQSYQGSITHAGTVTLDFDAATTVNQISLTGAVTFALSNLATNRTYRLRINNPQATNCTVTLPSNTSTNFLGGSPTTITAGKVVMWSLEAWGAANADVISAWAETQ